MTAYLSVPTGIANNSTVTLARDTVYQGTLDLTNKSNVSVVSATGSGARAAITPGQAITGWTVHSGNIYKATVGFVPTQLSLSNVPVKRASWPAVVPSWASAGTQPPVADLVGATLVQLSNQSVINTSVMGGNTVSSGVPYYVEGKLWMLSAANMWAYAAGVLYCWAPDGQTPEGRAWAAPDAVGIDCSSSSGVTINGVDVFSAFDGIGGADSTNLTIQNCTITNCANDGVYAGSSSGLLVDTVTVTNARRCGINAYYGSTAVTVRNCPSIANSGMVGNPGPSFAGIFIGATTGSLVTNNTVTNSSFHGISVNDNKNSTVSSNVVDGFCKILTDGAGIYTQCVDRNSLAITITNNTVKNGNGADVIGIYLDDGSNNCIVTYNTLIGNTTGMLLHDAFNNTVAYNNFSTSIATDLKFANSGSGATLTYGNQINHNSFTSTTNEYTYNLDAGTSFSSWATWDYNTYNSTNVALFARSWDGVSAGVDYSYTAWKSMIGQDASSTMNTTAVSGGAQPVASSRFTKLNGYAVLGTAQGRATLSKLDAYAVIGSAQGRATLSKLDAYAVIGSAQDNATLSKLNAYAVCIITPSGSLTAISGIAIAIASVTGRLRDYSAGALTGTATARAFVTAALTTAAADFGVAGAAGSQVFVCT